MNNEREGMVLEIQRMSTEDGPGIRTTLFLKGCTLKCEWCHNPESISYNGEVQWVGAGCIGCNICAGVCEREALKRAESGIAIDRDKCSGCGACADACPSGAIERIGRIWDAPSLVYELVKDRAYFEKSGGGVTISGGEVTMQADFAKEILILLKREGIHTAIDTCGQCRWERLEMLLPYADLVLYDLKEIDSALHREYTGSPNELILENIARLFALKSEGGYKGDVWIRTPVIPGTTARAENIRGIGSFVASLPALPEKWELCSFNNLCRDKYTRLGLVWRYSDSELLLKSEMEILSEIAVESGIPEEIVVWSGTVTDERDGSRRASQN